MHGARTGDTHGRGRPMAIDRFLPTFDVTQIRDAVVDAAEFATFDRPGYANLAIGVSVRPYGTDRTLVTCEARTATTDEASRRRFRRYWTLVGPFAGYLMGRVLETARTEVERGRRIPVE